MKIDSNTTLATHRKIVRIYLEVDLIKLLIGELCWMAIGKELRIRSFMWFVITIDVINILQTHVQ